MSEYEEHTQGAPPPRQLSEADELLLDGWRAIAPLLEGKIGLEGAQVDAYAKTFLWSRRARAYLDNEGII